MNLDRTLERCRRDRWTPDDLPWHLPATPLAADDERALVQSLVDMGAVERLAAALFAEQARRSTGVLREILETFVAEEHRHAEVADRLAARFDRRRLQAYAPHPALVRFADACAGALPLVSADVGNLAVTLGELVLDVALLRSIGDQCDDPVLADALRRIELDESRHIAIDYHLVEVGLPEPGRTFGDRVRQPLAWMRLLAAMRPFVRDVLVRCTERTDPGGVRLREAFARFHKLGERPAVRRRPFARLLLLAQQVADHPWWGPILGAPVAAALGADLSLVRSAR